MGARRTRTTAIVSACLVVSCPLALQSDPCSITGGYVYRGTRSTFTRATYVYGACCSGEIFTWDGAGQRQIFDTNLDIASFAEDEDGELYVVDLGGTIWRLARP